MLQISGYSFSDAKISRFSVPGVATGISGSKLLLTFSRIHFRRLQLKDQVRLLLNRTFPGSSVTPSGTKIDQANLSFSAAVFIYV